MTVNFLRYGVLMGLTMKLAICWYVILCSVVDRFQNFAGTFCFHLHLWRISHPGENSWHKKERNRNVGVRADPVLGPSGQYSLSGPAVCFTALWTVFTVRAGHLFYGPLDSICCQERPSVLGPSGQYALSGPAICFTALWTVFAVRDGHLF